MRDAQGLHPEQGETDCGRGHPPLPRKHERRRDTDNGRQKVRAEDVDGLRERTAGIAEQDDSRRSERREEERQRCGVGERADGEDGDRRAECGFGVLGQVANRFVARQQGPQKRLA